MEPIPLLDLKAHYSPLREEIMARVSEVIDSQRFILGPQVEALEKEMAKACRAPFAVGVASGTDALLLSLKALGIGQGHEVIVPSFTFFSTASTVVQAGARPVFVDIYPSTYNIDANEIEKAVTKNTRAIVPVHLYGQCADMDAIIKIARHHHLHVLEDACQSVTATFKGKAAGTIGDAGAISFYPTKNLGGFGDGGMIITRSEQIHQAVRGLRVFGASAEVKEIGYNSRLDELQAAVLRVKLRHLPELIKARQENARILNEGLSGLPLKTPAVLGGAEHTYNLYVIRTDRRDALKVHLDAQGIGNAIYYARPLHQMDCFAPFLPKNFSLIETERAARETLAIPVYPGLTGQQLERVIDSVRKFYK